MMVGAGCGRLMVVVMMEVVVTMVMAVVGVVTVTGLVALVLCVADGQLLALVARQLDGAADVCADGAFVPALPE